MSLLHPGDVLSQVTLPDLAVAALVAAALLGLFVVAELWARAGGGAPEATRKFVHVGVGAVAAGFPWWFASPWPVVGLAIVFALALAVSRRWGLLRSIHAVPRASEGDFYYLAAILVLFLVGRGKPVFYLIAILTLVLSDTLAALVGSAYGRRTYRVEGHHRTLEGSTVFFLATLLAAHLPLLLLTDLDRAATVLVGLQVALLVTCFEAVSLRGNDNLIVPLATYFLLTKLTRYPAAWIGGQIAVELAILLGLVVVARRWRVLTTSGVLAAHLFFYGVLALCGVPWGVAPALALAGFLVAGGSHGRAAPADGQYQVVAVFYVGASAGALFLLDNAARTFLPVRLVQLQGLLFPAYVGALAAQLGIVLLLRRGPAAAGGGRFRTGVIAAAASSLMVVPLPLLLAGSWTPPAVAAATLVGVGGVGVYAAFRGRLARRLGRTADLRLQAASVAVATCVSLGAHLWLGGGS